MKVTSRTSYVAHASSATIIEHAIDLLHLPIFLFSTALLLHFLFSTALLLHFLFSTALLLHFLFSTALLLHFLFSTALLLHFLFSTALILHFVFSTALLLHFLFSTALLLHFLFFTTIHLPLSSALRYVCSLRISGVSLFQIDYSHLFTYLHRCFPVDLFPFVLHIILEAG